MVKQAEYGAGVKDIHPHILSHTFVTDLFRSTRNLVLTQVALGLSSITTTEIYTHVAPVELEEAMKGLRLRKNLQSFHELRCNHDNIIEYLLFLEKSVNIAVTLQWTIFII
jgi:hypothetical protein